MRLLCVRYRPSFAGMLIGGMTGVWMHVFIDSFYHWDVQPFWPRPGNPFYRFARTGPIRITPARIEMMCLALLLAAVILYASAVRSFLKDRKRQSNNRHLQL